MICPLCEQGSVCLVQVNNTDDRAYVCGECERLWPVGTAIVPRALDGLDTYVARSLGIELDQVMNLGGWCFVTILEDPADLK